MHFIQCNKKREKRRRTTLSITIDPQVLDNLKEWMKREGEASISAVIEDFVKCGIRDTCVGCEYYDGDEEVVDKVGVGKQIVE